MRGKKKTVLVKWELFNLCGTTCIPVMFRYTEKYLTSRGRTELLQIQTGVVL